MGTLCEQAARLDGQHQIRHAIASYRRWIAETPHDHRRRHRLIQLLMETSQYEEATVVAEDGLAVAESAPVMAAYAEIHQAYYRVAAALECAQRAVKLDEQCGAAWHALVTTRGLLGHENQQQEALKRGLERCPDHVDLHIEWATRPTQSPIQQLTALNVLRSKFPRHRSCWFNQLIVLSTVRPGADSRKARLEFLNLNRRNHGALAVHGLHAYIDGDLLEAEALSREALDMWPRSVFALYTLFHVHFLRDEIGWATDYLAQVDALTRGTSTHTSFATQMMVTLGQHERAIQSVQALIKAGGDTLGAQIALAQTEESVHQRNRALERVGGMPLSARSRYDVIGLMARNLVELSRFSEAEPWVERLDGGQEKALLQTRIRVSRLADVDEIRQAYTQHLLEYPSLDFAWGLLFRDAVESASLEAITMLTTDPFAVPIFVQHAAFGYAQACLGQFESARQHLDEIVRLQSVEVRWIWAWEFALEASEFPALASFYDTLTQAAKMDGFISDSSMLLGTNETILSDD